LHIDRNKKDSERIDTENSKILEAISNIKPLIPITSNLKDSARQKELLKNISKTKKQDMAEIIRKRAELLEIKKKHFPSILDYKLIRDKLTEQYHDRSSP